MPRNIIEYGLDFDGCASILAYPRLETFISGWAHYQATNYRGDRVEGASTEYWIKVLTEHTPQFLETRDNLRRFLKERQGEVDTEVRVSSATNRVSNGFDRGLMDIYAMEHTAHELLIEMCTREQLMFIPARLGDRAIEQAYVDISLPHLGIHDLHVTVGNLHDTIYVRGEYYEYHHLMKVAIAQQRIDAMDRENPLGNNEYYFVDDRAREFGDSLRALLNVPPSVTVHITEYDNYLASQGQATSPRVLYAIHSQRPPREQHPVTHLRQANEERREEKAERCDDARISLDEFREAYEADVAEERKHTMRIFRCLVRQPMGKKLAADSVTMAEVEAHAANKEDSRTAKVMRKLRQQRRMP